jgi:radical SAM superfamily enzyme YgiQ (UPF0313 family)
MTAVSARSSKCGAETFIPNSFDRVLEDIRNACDHGARTIFLVDDNITLNVRRFVALCKAIIEAGLNKLDYFVQAMTSAIADHGEILAPLMHRAGFRYVFLGIENILEGDLEFLRAAAKNTARRKGSDLGNATLKAIRYLHRNKMYVVGGLIVGNPDDTRESIEANLAPCTHLRQALCGADCAKASVTSCTRGLCFRYWLCLGS